MIKLLTLGNLLLIALLCSLSPAAAQVALKTRPPVPQYVLGAGDQILLHVDDMDNMPDKPIRIDPNGFIDLPLAGRVQAAGLTIDQFKAELAAKLRKYVDSPQISVNLTEGQSRPVSVIGAVNTPGVEQLQGPRRLIEVISLAGGVRPDAGSKVIVTRQLKWGKLPLPDVTVDAASGTSTATLSLDNLLASKDPANNISVEPNDTIAIPKAQVVYVLGNVKKAGGFTLSSHNSISLLQALSLAEGMDHNAAGGKARILRPAPNGDGQPQQIPVNISKIVSGKAPDVPLYANDVLFVPNSGLKSAGREAAQAALTVATGVIIYR